MQTEQKTNVVKPKMQKVLCLHEIGKVRIGTWDAVAPCCTSRRERSPPARAHASGGMDRRLLGRKHPSRDFSHSKGYVGLADLRFAESSPGHSL